MNDSGQSSISNGRRRLPVATLLVGFGSLLMIGIIIGVVLYATNLDTDATTTTSSDSNVEASKEFTQTGPTTPSPSLAPISQATAPTGSPAPVDDTPTNTAIRSAAATSQNPTVFVASQKPTTLSMGESDYPTVLMTASEIPSATPTTTASDSPTVTESANPTVTTSANPTTTTIGNRTTDSVTPRLGSVDGVEYYHCSAQTTDSSSVQHIVLLHGGAFTKEDWLDIGVLDQFCAVPRVSVTALDLGFPGHQGLKNILDALDTSSDVQVSKPVVLVTPSASGITMVDWIINGDASEIPSYIDTWVPVATGSLSQASDEQVQSLIPLPVLAIYGDQDTAGGRLSRRLGELVGAMVVELQGGHPVYLQSPIEFVQEILRFLGVE